MQIMTEQTSCTFLCIFGIYYEIPVSVAPFSESDP